jgi:glycosyltransferase involved in cell wall biosynthesis
MQIALRIKGSGIAHIHRIIIGGAAEKNTSGKCYLPHSSILVLTNQYPSQGNLYRNMFVHRRASGYKEDNITCDVMRMNIYAKEHYYEFEGIDVIDGQSEILKRILDTGSIKTICIHFLDRTMWTVIKEYLDSIRVIIWLHGAEIQPWWRRTFNYTNDIDLKQSKLDTDILLEFWGEVFSNAGNDALHFVFVSQYFADEVMKDNGVLLPRTSYSIIHNFIDTDLFKNQPKTNDMRTKILSIKPYASRKYANDLTTKAIVTLSKYDIFKKLEIYIYGDGEMFDTETAPLRHFKNVHLHKAFLSQREIVDLHKNCGVYIATTRMDAQGVSRDEAMSSGLVPIANAVAAIPEFVDEDCGLLVPAEDYIGVAQAILTLYNNPDLFIKLSSAAAERVRKQSSRKHTIEKEEQIIKSDLKKS